MILLGTRPDYAQSIELDKQIGAENAELVKVQMGIYDLEVLTRYVRKVGDRLVANLEDPQFQFQFHVVDDPIPNAFALPGGYVYVYFFFSDLGHQNLLGYYISKLKFVYGFRFLNKKHPLRKVL